MTNKNSKPRRIGMATANKAAHDNTDIRIKKKVINNRPILIITLVTPNSNTQYKRFVLPNGNVNGGNSIGENIGDSIGENIGDSIGENIGDNLNATQSKILQLMKTTATISGKDIAESIGISQRNVEANIRILKKMGLVERVGSAKGGHWVVK